MRQDQICFYREICGELAENWLQRSMKNALSLNHKNDGQVNSEIFAKYEIAPSSGTLVFLHQAIEFSLPLQRDAKWMGVCFF